MAGANIGSYNVRIGLDVSRLRAGARQAVSVLSRFNSRIRSIAASIRSSLVVQVTAAAGAFLSLSYAVNKVTESFRRVLTVQRELGVIEALVSTPEQFDAITTSIDRLVERYGLLRDEATAAMAPIAELVSLRPEVMTPEAIDALARLFGVIGPEGAGGVSRQLAQIAAKGVASAQDIKIIREWARIASQQLSLLGEAPSFEDVIAALVRTTEQERFRQQEQAFLAAPATELQRVRARIAETLDQMIQQNADELVQAIQRFGDLMIRLINALQPLIGPFLTLFEMVVRFVENLATLSEQAGQAFGPMGQVAVLIGGLILGFKAIFSPLKTLRAAFMLLSGVVRVGLKLLLGGFRLIFKAAGLLSGTFMRVGRILAVRLLAFAGVVGLLITAGSFLARTFGVAREKAKFAVRGDSFADASIEMTNKKGFLDRAYEAGVKGMFAVVKGAARLFNIWGVRDEDRRGRELDKRIREVRERIRQKTIEEELTKTPEQKLTEFFEGSEVRAAMSQLAKTVRERVTKAFEELATRLDQFMSQLSVRFTAAVSGRDPQLEQLRRVALSLRNAAQMFGREELQKFLESAAGRKLLSDVEKIKPGAADELMEALTSGLDDSRILAERLFDEIIVSINEAEARAKELREAMEWIQSRRTAWARFREGQDPFREIREIIGGGLLQGMTPDQIMAGFGPALIHKIVEVLDRRIPKATELVQAPEFGTTAAINRINRLQSLQQRQVQLQARANAILQQILNTEQQQLDAIRELEAREEARNIIRF